MIPNQWEERLANGTVVDFPASASEAPEPLPVIDMALWDAFPPPPRQWAVTNTVPLGEVTLLTGAGGVGKSLVSQQLATCVAMGRDFLGSFTRKASAMYLTWEDDEDELRRRQASICKALGISHTDLGGRLDLVSLKGRVGGELARFDATGRLIVSDTWRQIEAHLDTHDTGFLVLDNASHAMIGDHNAVECVAPFLGLLESATARRLRSILLLHHTNKAGHDWLGSVAYENQVRSRLVLTRNETDRESLTLANPKANYAAGGDVATFRWHEGAFLRDEDMSADYRGQIAITTAATADNAIFLACLTERIKQQRAVSEKRSPTFAPTEFAKMPESKRIGKARLEAAMDRLFRIGEIERGELWKGDDRKWVYGLKMAAGNGAVDTVRETLTTVQNSAENRAGNAEGIHTYTTYSGAASAAAAPTSEAKASEPHAGGDPDDPDDPANFILGEA